MDSDEDDEEGMFPPAGGPPGIPQWGGGQPQGHMWGEGQALVGEVLNPEDNLPHHRQDPKELAGTVDRLSLV